jgi:hypothetical protein
MFKKYSSTGIFLRIFLIVMLIAIGIQYLQRRSSSDKQLHNEPDIKQSSATPPPTVQHSNLGLIVASVMIIAWWSGWMRIFDTYLTKTDWFWFLIVVPIVYFFLSEHSLQEL